MTATSLGHWSGGAPFVLLMLVGCGVAPSTDTKRDTIFKDCPTCPEMVVVPAGRFMMGSDRTLAVMGKVRPEGPVHEVIVSRAFALGKTEVTNKQYKLFADATGYEPSSDCSKWRGSVVKFGGDWTDPDYGRPPKPSEPVVCVSWHDAKAYVSWLSQSTGKPYRLPTEAEWEYSARAGATTPWPWGDDEEGVCKYANVFDAKGPESPYAQEYLTWDPIGCSDGHARVAPVGSLAANRFGLHDMIGNVWEWNEDCSLELYSAQKANTEAVQVEGACEKRAVRGGSWLTRIERQRPTFRGRDPELLASHIFGFRVARDVAADAAN